MNPNLEPEDIRILAGDLELGRVQLQVLQEEWQELEIGPFDWKDGELLVLVSAGRGAVVVDAVELEWP